LDLTNNVSKLLSAVSVCGPSKLHWKRFLVVFHFGASDAVVAVNDVTVARFTHPVKQQRFDLQVFEVLLVVSH
jgi:hypothetical protein